MGKYLRAYTSSRPWPALLRRSAAAEYAGVDESTIDRHRRRGQLVPAGRLGGTGEFTYTRAELDRWLAGVSVSRSPSGHPDGAPGDDVIVRKAVTS